MATAAKAPLVPKADLESFTAHLKSSDRILALLGAGLSASSGLPTFRGAGGLWRSHDAMSLATPEAFAANPALVWEFYSYRRHMALQAKPNRAHFALAELARRKHNFLTLSQNVDGLSPRAAHPASRLHLLHGSLFDVKCTSFYCSYYEENNFTDPIVPALAVPPTTPTQTDPSSFTAVRPPQDPKIQDSTLSDPPTSNQTISIPRDALPHCPSCKSGLLRPGVVWFGELLPEKTMDAIGDFIESAPPIDLILVIGTSAQVYPAAGYVDMARMKGARVAVVNTDPNDCPGGEGGLKVGDWFFQGDASVLVPEILKGVVGEI